MPNENPNGEQTEESTGPSQDDYAQLQRENTFLRAGIDTSSVLGGMFFQTYDGELTPEAVTEGARQVPGLIPEETPASPSTTAEQPRPSEEEQAMGDALSAVGSTPSAPAEAQTTPAPERALDAYNEEVGSGRPREQGAAAFLSTLITAAVDGDQTAVFDRERWLAENGHVPGT